MTTPPKKKIVRRRSAIAGWGVYAAERITKNSRIVHYAGEPITHKQSLPREIRYLKKRHIWCFTVNNHKVIDAAVGGNIARFINHSCRPNCYTHIVDGTIWIRAARNIAPGDELTYEYNTGGSAGIACRCRPRCTTRL